MDEPAWLRYTFPTDWTLPLTSKVMSFVNIHESGMFPLIRARKFELSIFNEMFNEKVLLTKAAETAVGEALKLALADPEGRDPLMQPLVEAVFARDFETTWSIVKNSTLTSFLK